MAILNTDERGLWQHRSKRLLPSPGKVMIVMNILVLPDSFKECLDAFAVAEAISRGLHHGAKEPPQILCRPMADGGEGLSRVILQARGGTTTALEVTGPMGPPVPSSLSLVEGGRTAVIEMAAAAGLVLVPLQERNPLKATTRGVGELIRAALDLGVRRIIVGLGGSATNDGGAGMAQALGISLRDADGKELAWGGGELERLHTIDLSRRDSRLRDVEIIGACDVTNVLCGSGGASHVYGPQKGASPEVAERLDQALHHFGSLVLAQTGKDVLTLSGGGAAGGLGAGLAAFADAHLRPGIDLVFEAYGDMEEQASKADLIISGEGSLDGQTLFGKVVAGVALLAKRHEKPLVVLAGRIKGDLAPLYESGVTAVFPIAPEPMSPADAITSASTYLEQSAENLARFAECLLGSSANV